MEKYEIIIISVAEDKVSAIKEIVGQSTKILEEQLIGERKLAYKIRKMASGFYCRYLAEADATDILDLQKKLLHEKNTLRFLIIKTKKTTFKVETRVGRPMARPEAKPVAKEEEKPETTAASETTEVKKETKKPAKTDGFRVKPACPVGRPGMTIEQPGMTTEIKKKIIKPKAKKVSLKELDEKLEELLKE